MQTAISISIVAVLTLAGPNPIPDLWEPLKGEGIGYQAYWPNGLKELVKAHPPAAGMKNVIQGFDRSYAVLYFTGAQDDLQKFIDRLAELKHRPLTIVLEPGDGNLGGLLPAPYHWRLEIGRAVKRPLPNRALLMCSAGLEGNTLTTVALAVRVGRKLKLDELRIPADIEVKRRDRPVRGAARGDPKNSQ